MKDFFLISILFVLDQTSKFLARTNFEAPLEVLPFFRLQFTENTGIAFSIPFPKIAIVTLTTGILIGLAWILKNKKLRPCEHMGFLLIFAGALGNITDRIFLGAVTDFLSFWSFPIFNFADSFITIGMGVIVWQELFARQKK